MIKNIENIELQYLTINDYQELKQAMIEVYVNMQNVFWEESQIQSLITKFPEGQIVIKINNQIVFSYENKVNGSVSQIAGVCNSDGNVVGMMPHPERAAEKAINQIDHKPSSLIFESLIETVGMKK